MAKLQNLARFKKVSEFETVSTMTDYHEALFSNTDTVGIFKGVVLIRWTGVGYLSF